jgi:isopentenyl diphosphate isomerase/L-lactate dehydrogenase-like FMN-dependent dehydrogenase
MTHSYSNTYYEITLVSKVTLWKHVVIVHHNMKNLKSSISTYLQFYGYDVFSELSFNNAKKK